jgi:hypothetical protein
MGTITKCWDINLVAYLLCKGFTSLTPPKQEKQGKVYFYFNSTPELETEISNFYTGKSPVDAQVYSGHLRRLRVALEIFGKRGGGRIE